MSKPCTLVACLLVFGCSSSPSVSPDVGPPQTGDDRSEVPSSVQRPVSLKLLSQVDVTPTGQAAYRPDVTAIGGELWLAYNSGAGLMLQRFDAALNKVGQAVALLSAAEKPAAEMVTDTRVGSADGQFWMAYETITTPEIACNEHLLNAASYQGSPPQVSQSAKHIAAGCALSKEFIDHPTGLPPNPEIADDPTPFYHRGARYVLTRGWGTRSVHHLRKLGVSLSTVEDMLLDTGTAVPGRQMSQSALLHIKGNPFLVAGFPSGMWVSPNTSALYILPLSDDLRSVSGPSARLSVTSTTFPTRVTRARHVNGTLIINFIDAFVDSSAGLKVSEHLALFDANAGYALLSQLQVQDHQVADNHSSFEILDDRLYLFQQQDGQKLSAKIFKLTAAQTGACGTACSFGTICCEAPLPCAGSCVADCRIAGNVCPQQAPSCDQTNGVCK